MATTADYTQVAEQLYLAYFGRPADRDGLDNMTASLLAGGAPTDIADFKAAYAAGGVVKTVLDNFGNSTESQTLYSGGDTQFILAIYQNMLGRAPLPAGLDFWTAALRHQDISRAEAARQVMAAACKPDGNAADAAVVHARLTMASLFTAALDTGDEASYYHGRQAAQDVRDLIGTTSAGADATALRAIVDQFLAQHVAHAGGMQASLLNGPDSISGGAGDDVIHAGTGPSGGDTLDAGDSIDGGAGYDVMQLTTEGAVSTEVAVTDVETVNLTSLHALDAADLSGWAGLASLTITASGDIGGVVAAATTDVTVAGAKGAVALNGGHNVLVSTGGGDIDVGSDGAAAGNVTAFNSTAGGTTSVAAAGVATVVASSGAVNIAGASAFVVSAAGAVTLAERSAHAAALAGASAADAAAVAGTDAAGLARLAAAAVVAALHTLADDIGAASGVSAGAGAELSIQHASATALHAGAISGAQKIALDAAFGAALPASHAAAVAAAQAVLATIEAAAGAASAAADAADAGNIASAAARLAAATAVADADQAAAASAAAVLVTATSNTALSAATVNGNYGADGNTIVDASAQHDTLLAVTLDNAGATTITGDAVTRLYATGMNDDVKLVNGSAGHTVALTLSAVAGGTYTDDSAGSVRLVTNGSTQNVLAGLHVAGAGAITVSGAAGVDFGTLEAAPGAVINASAASGRNAISVAAGQSYLGGSGADVVTTGNVVQTVAVDGGAGNADQLIVTGSANGAGAAAAWFKGFEVLQVNAGVVADAAAYTGSAFTSVILAGDGEIDGMNPTQAAHVALAGGQQAIVLGVSGASTPGQIDHVTISNATAAATLTTPSLAGIEKLTLVAGADLSVDGLTSATALTSIDAAGAGQLNIATGALALNAHTVIDARQVTGSVTVDASASSGNGVQITGSASASNHLSGNSDHGNTLIGGNGGDTLAGGAAADVLRAGNGNNTITGNGGDDTISVGDGDNTIDASGGGASAIRAGNGWNDIIGGDGADTIEVGSGGNLITGGAGADTITFGSHAAGVVDGLAYTTLSAGSDTGAAITASGVLAEVDVIAGLHAHDTVNLGQPGGLLANDLGGTFAHAVTAGTAAVEMVRGNYVAATGLFTAAANGADAMLAWADGNAGHGTAAIVLVGYAGSAHSTLSAAGVVTLG
jgi:hypothetical protein